MRKSGGSPIPIDFEKINIIHTEPIFIRLDAITIIRKDIINSYSLKHIGEGSYANVYKYKDDFYNIYFAVKRIKNGANVKELKRFKLEYNEMKKLKSPYVIEVYKYNEEKNEYVMEFADETLKQYISSNNTILSNDERKSIVNQILRAFSYINFNGLLHRDISLNNILIKKYDKLVVIKLSDFGLVKLPESQLTSELSELKGSLNDPDLEVQGFEKYNIIHETYALTRLIYFVMTGKINRQKIENESLEKFVTKGINKETKKRFQSIDELKNAFNSLKF